MGDLIAFSESPLMVTSEAKTWVARDTPAVEVGRYDELDLQLYVVGFQAGGDAKLFELVIETSMFGEETKGNDQSWVKLGAFTAVAAAPSSERVTFRNLLRYVRWRVITLDDADAAYFYLSGIVRARL